MHDKYAVLTLVLALSGTHAAAQDLTSNTAPSATESTGASPSGYQDGFRLASGPEPFSVTLNGFVQTRYTWLEPDLGESVQTFDVALARLSLGGQAFDERVSYFFQLEASTFGDSNRLSLLDGWMQYRVGPAASVKAGRILLPYSRQFLTHPGNLMFTDLSAADYAFNLPRAVGFNVGGSRGRVSYDGAIANSVRALDAGGQQNPDGKLAVMARADVAVLAPYGYLETAPGGADSRQWSVGGAVAANPVVEASAFQNVLPGDRTTSFTVDTGYRDRRVSVQAAVYLRRNDTGASELFDRGGYVQAGAWLVPAAWEAVARVSTVDFDGERPGLASGDRREIEAGLNRYLHGHHVKVQGDAALVHHRLFAGGTRDDVRVRIHFQLLF